MDEKISSFKDCQVTYTGNNVFVWAPERKKPLTKIEEAELGVVSKTIIDGSIILTTTQGEFKFNPENNHWIKIKFED